MMNCCSPARRELALRLWTLSVSTHIAMHGDQGFQSQSIDATCCGERLKVRPLISVGTCTWATRNMAAILLTGQATNGVTSWAARVHSEIIKSFNIFFSFF